MIDVPCLKGLLVVVVVVFVVVVVVTFAEMIIVFGKACVIADVVALVGKTFVVVRTIAADVVVEVLVNNTGRQVFLVIGVTCQTP